MLSVQNARRHSGLSPPQSAEQGARFHSLPIPRAIPQPRVGVTSTPCTRSIHFNVVWELLGPGDVHIEGLQNRAHSADDFARPKRLAEDRDPAFGSFADGAKRIAGVGGFVSIQAPLGKLAFKGRVLVFRGGSGAKAERFGFEAGYELLQDLDDRLRNHDAAAGGLAEVDLVGGAKIAHAVEMTEKVDGVMLLASQGRENRCPDVSGILAGERLATFRFDELKPHGLGFRTEIEALYIEGIRRQVRSGIFGVHRYSSASNSPNFSRNSGEVLRTSNQSKKASGVSSQMRNHSAISFFSSRFCGSTLRLCEIISARRFPRRAISRTRSTAAFSP